MCVDSEYDSCMTMYIVESEYYTTVVVMHDHIYYASSRLVASSLQGVRGELPPSLCLPLPSDRRKFFNFLHSLALECCGRRMLVIIHDDVQALASSLFRCVARS